MDKIQLQAALQTVSKAVAAFIVTALVGIAARYGFNADQNTQDALGFVVTGLISGGLGYVAVYLAPKNKETK